MSSRRKFLLILVAIIALAVIVVFIRDVYLIAARDHQLADWLGLGDYTSPTGEYYRAKTAWDFLELLIIPIVLAIVAFWFDKSERKADRVAAEERATVDRELATDRTQETALQTYINRMAELLLKENLRDAPEDDEVRSIARAMTLTTLRTLSGNRKGDLIQFLFEAKLIERGNAIIDLDGAILYQADLRNCHLLEVDLSGANLSGAYLSEANLSGADLSEADLSGADLLGADLSHADLRGADVSTEQLETIISLTNTVMPDGTQYMAASDEHEST